MLNEAIHEGGNENTYSNSNNRLSWCHGEPEIGWQNQNRPVHQVEAVADLSNGTQRGEREECTHGTTARCANRAAQTDRGHAANERR